MEELKLILMVLTRWFQNIFYYRLHIQLFMIL